MTGESEKGVRQHVEQGFLKARFHNDKDRGGFWDQATPITCVGVGRCEAGSLCHSVLLTGTSSE